MFKKHLACLLVCACVVMAGNIVNANELVVTEYGIQNYQDIKDALFKKPIKKNLIDHLLSLNFSDNQIASATGYFLNEIQEGREQHFTVYKLNGIYDNETGKWMIEGIIKNLVCFQSLKKLRDAFVDIDPMQIADLEERRTFIERNNALNKNLDIFKANYFEQDFPREWIVYSLLCLGDDFDKIVGFSPESPPEKLGVVRWPDLN